MPATLPIGEDIVVNQQPNETVQVHLDEDDSLGPYFREDPSGAYEIPRGQLNRWKSIENAYREMQDGIVALLNSGTKFVDRAAENR
ncbi:hypothetical protein [Streptomyces sp. NPDC060205]|uniref:hypothetical protein n=1 Tax=Streptomyces sp. NPDC060205 TaxID=3347072 RepID=UPI00364C4664